MALFQALSSANISAAHYETVISGFAALLSCWQPQFALAAQTYAIPDFAHIADHGLALQQDITGFSAPCCLPEPAAATICSPEDYLGYSYVWHGASLGAQFILARLRASALNTNYPFAYYQQLSQQSQAATHWPLWCADLNTYAAKQQLSTTAITLAAQRCFSQIIDWFSVLPVATDIAAE
ncbi:hypothetical protein LMJ53_05610 [Rheinheimera sp. UJ51]|uniref:biliverdin-producing heme oxygenase n=1 Tax=Rheinheimera sp. UJ51 TaxID=2892446 RepID=UPI001E45A849|nr:biliverdin-producing heme oxygenase [Rheinheimera sp. UJ51]MCC5451207.1 hypothetical protein [Rheinheimera sp. UJ51]